MDVLLEGLRFGLAILAGGIVAVITSILSFRYARKLSLEERQATEDAARREKEERDDAAARALVTEMREILAATDHPNQSHLGALPRTAWDEGRRLELPPEIRRLSREAYGLADLFNAQLAIIASREGNPSVNSTGPDRETAVAIAAKVHAAFEEALAHLDPERRRVGERR